MINNERKKSHEIVFRDNFESEEEKRFEIWNHSERRMENYVIKKEKNDIYSLYLEPAHSEDTILDYYGMWSDLTEDEFQIITDSINDIRKRITNTFIHDEH